MIVNLAKLRPPSATASSLPSEFSDGDPRKLQHLSLEQQKKRAKELLRDLRSNKPQAIARYKNHFSTASFSSGTGPRLCDAQQIIARENGFGKWTELKAHCERLQIALKSISEGSLSALDGDTPTLHIRCGHDIMHKLAVAGFTGDFLAFADPYVQGPVPRLDSLSEFIQVRAQFLLPWFDSLEKAIDRLAQDYAALETATTYPRVMLWFEHDSYDQLILAKLLHFFHYSETRPEQLQFICVSQFPGVQRFNGIGQLPAEALRMLWHQFSDVNEEHLILGARAWDAITAPTPLALMDLIATGTPAIPAMAKALSRHLRELPAKNNGLSLTEQLTLKILAEEGPMNAARLFGRYTNHYEPLTFLGDSQYWMVISGLANAENPAITIEQHGEKPVDWEVSLTHLGHELLNDKADWLAMNYVQRWVGGVRIDSRSKTAWRFDGI